MINLLLFIIALTCFGMAAAWLAENPGNVTLYWFDWRIDTSVAVLLAAVVAAGMLIAFIYLILRIIIKGPGNLSLRSKLKQKDKGLTELTYSIAALAANDTCSAAQHTKKAEKLLGKTPVTLLLGAQVAGQQGDEAKTRRLLEQLLDHPETEYLAARSLSETATKQKLLPRALTLAKRAQSVNPKEAGPVRSIVSLYMKQAQWEEALMAARKYGRKSELSRAELRRMEAVIHMARGQNLLAEGGANSALVSSKKALKLLPEFVPAILLTAEAMQRSGNEKAAFKLLKNAWKKHEHPHIAEKLKQIAQVNEKKHAKLLDMLGKKRGQAVPLYQCAHCGHSQPGWEAHCPACDAFDSMG